MHNGKEAKRCRIMKRIDTYLKSRALNTPTSIPKIYIVHSSDLNEAGYAS